MLYHPPHLPNAVFTHISFVTKDYFVVGNSTTGRMTPIRHAQNVLKLKLDLTDVERELQGDAMGAPEKLLWRRWLDAQNQRTARKSRVRASCCGRYTYRHQLEEDETGALWCDDCWRVPTLEWPSAQPVQPAELAGAHPEPNPNEPTAYPWRRKLDGDAIAPPTKRPCAPLRGIVEQTSADGSCFLVVFDGFEERALLYQKDVLGVPTVGGTIEAACYRVVMH